MGESVFCMQLMLDTRKGRSMQKGSAIVFTWSMTG